MLNPICMRQYLRLMEGLVSHCWQSIEIKRTRSDKGMTTFSTYAISPVAGAWGDCFTLQHLSLVHASHLTT